MKGFFRLFLVAVVLVSGAGYSRAPAEHTTAAEANALFVPDQAPALLTPDLTDLQGHLHFFDLPAPAPAEGVLVFGSTAAVVLGGDAADEPADRRLFQPAGFSTLAGAAAAADAAGAVRPVAGNNVSYLGRPTAAASPVRTLAASGAVERLIPVRAPAERSGWMLLLCSFVVVGFIAQRKSRLITG